MDKTIKIQEEVKIELEDRTVILEKGDSIKVLPPKEESSLKEASLDIMSLLYTIPNFIGVIAKYVEDNAGQSMGGDIDDLRRLEKSVFRAIDKLQYLHAVSVKLPREFKNVDDALITVFTKYRK